MNNAHKRGHLFQICVPSQNQPIRVKGFTLEDAIVKFVRAEGIEISSVGKGLVPESDQSNKIVVMEGTQAGMFKNRH